MYISTRIDDKVLGGYPFTKATVSVMYSNEQKVSRDVTKAQWYRDFLERWAGTEAPDHLCTWPSYEPLIHEGELIQYAHAKLFSEHLSDIYHRAGWAASAEWRDWFRERKQAHSRENGWAPEGVKIHFQHLDTEKNRQLCSEVVVTPEIAGWLSRVLEDYANGNSPPDHFHSQMFGPERWLRTRHMSQAELQAFEQAERKEEAARKKKAARDAQAASKLQDAIDAAGTNEEPSVGRIIRFPTDRANSAEQSQGD